MANKHYNYGEARNAFGKEIADALWHEFPRDETNAVVTAEERNFLSSKPSVNDSRTQQVINSIKKRSFGGGSR